MIPGAIETITEEVLSRLVSNGVPESRTLEFKRDLPGGANDDKKEFLADVTAFANTLGGDLIYGVDEAGGIASAADGVVVEDMDAAQLRLEQLLRDGVEPRLASVRMHWVPLASAFVDRLKQKAEPTGSFATEDMARNGGLEGLYVLFRQLSSDAAHPLLEALNRYVDDGHGGLRAEILWGPACGADEIEDTVTMACCFLLVGAVTLNMACPVLGVGDQLGDHFDTYKSLLSSASAQGQ